MNDTENERLSLSGPTETRNSCDQLKQLDEQTKAWGDSTQLRQIAEQAKAWGSNTQLKQLAEQTKAWGSNTQLKKLAEQAKAWGSDTQLKQLAEEINAWGSSTQLKQLAEQAKTWRNNCKLRQIAEQTLTWGLTFDVVVGELVARSGKSGEVSTAELKPNQNVADIEELVSIGDDFIGGVISTPSTTPVLSKIPTWILYLWMICFAPALFVLSNWEAVRAGLVDINARMPQTKSIAEFRRFIHSNLAGKPGDIRLITRSDVRLRVAPGMKSTVIMTLPQYAPVVVLGKEDRTWLYVSYEHEGFLIDGYVSTKFLKKIRK